MMGAPPRLALGLPPYESGVVTAGPKGVKL